MGRGPLHYRWRSKATEINLACNTSALDISELEAEEIQMAYESCHGGHFSTQRLHCFALLAFVRESYRSDFAKEIYINITSTILCILKHDLRNRILSVISATSRTGIRIRASRFAICFNESKEHIHVATYCSISWIDRRNRVALNIYWASFIRR